MTITTIGVDLAKNSFQLHGVDHTGRTVLRKKLSRSRFLEFFADLPACTIGMEACGGAHHWARVPVHSLETPVCAYAAIDMVAN
jgi:transposase